MSDALLISLSIIAGVFLGAVSNWIYDLLKGKIFPKRLKIKGLFIIFVSVLPLIFLVALPAISSSSREERDLRILAATIVANEQQRQSLASTAAALQTQQFVSVASSNNAQATQTAVANDVANVRATSQALSIQATQIQATVQAIVPPFVIVSIKPIANQKSDAFVNPLSGNYKFKGIPFTFLSGSKAIFQSQIIEAGYPASASLDVTIPHPTNVYLLLNGGWVRKSFIGQTTGIIRLSFLSGQQLDYNIVVGQNLREDWGYDTGYEDVVTELTETSEWTNVYSEIQSRGGKPAKAFIDMIQISLPMQYQYSALTKIEIIDTSVENVGSLSPSLKLLAITVSTTQ